MTKADAKNFLLHLVDFLDDITELKDPIMILKGIVRASTDNEAIVFLKIFLVRKLTADDSKGVPMLSFISERCHEHVVVSSVSFLHEL